VNAAGLLEQAAVNAAGMLEPAPVNAAVPEPAAVNAAGLPQRVPQPHLLPDPPLSGETEGDADRRLDPTAIAAAMSAYARGVAGYRVPSS
jgi:hypothetical protein